jgi:phenylalanyl-tRNA synthetase alpha chain
MPKTKLIYLEDSYKQSDTAIVTSVSVAGTTTTITLNQTLFYPQGGGQPSDKGTITGPNGTMKVTHAQFRNGTIEHLGKVTGSIAKGDTVTLELDWPLRYHHMQLHTAGHVIDEAVKMILPEFHGIDGMHGIGHQQYIVYPGFIDTTHIPNIQQKVDDLIREDLPITSRMVTLEQIQQEGIYLPFELPQNKPLRLIQMGDYPPVPDGGTQLKSTGVLWSTTISDVTYNNNQTTIHYQVETPKVTQDPPVIDSPKNNQPAVNELMTKLDQLKQAVIEADKTDAARIEFLGKKGKFNQIAAMVRDLPQAERKLAGQHLNQAKAHLEALFIAKPDAQESADFFDATLPGKLPSLGHLHPITQAIDRIQRIFEGIGFTRVRYPEVDWDYYAFEALNMPPKHAARDEWETFFIDAPSHPKYGQLFLTPHTSNGQVREMERVGSPPIRMLNIAKCYRRQEDVTHTAMFHQFEGLVIDKGITIQHLKGTLDYFARKFYGDTAKSRIRPFMFKFTEPSFEVDFSCVHCDGKGCRFCKSGWHEVGGAGMVHPNVLKYGGIDPKEYTGFAFGWGIERVYTLQPGLHLDDIRPLYQNKMTFLRQF